MVAALVCATFLPGWGAAAGERLTADGAALRAPLTPASAKPLSITVQLQGDVPTATHVFARFANNQPRQRTNEGFWIPWSGNPADLIDNRFKPVGDTLTFKITNEDLEGAFLPVTFFVAYRVGGLMKSGSVTVVRP